MAGDSVYLEHSFSVILGPPPAPPAALSPSALSRLLLTPHEVVIDVQWSNDRGATWTPVRVREGTVTADRTSQTRWSMNATLELGPTMDLNGVNPYHTRVKARRGIKPLRGDPRWFSIGQYRVSKTTKAYGDVIQVEGESFEKYVQDYRLIVPRTIGGGPGDTGQVIVEALIHEAMPEAGFLWLMGSTDALIPTIQQDQDRWALIDGDTDSTSVARAIGAEVYCDGDGTFVVAPVPELTDEPVWTVEHGGALVSTSNELSRENVYNVVVANGESTDSDKAPVGPGIAWDDDPNSPTYAGPDPLNHPELAGAFGLVTRYYTSPLLVDDVGCQNAAQSILANALGLQKNVSFDALTNPTLVPGQVVRIEVDEGLYENHVLDSVSYGLADPTMSCTTRASQTTLLGTGLVDADAGGDVAAGDAGVA